MLNPNLHTINLLNIEYSIYSKHFKIDEIGLDGQKRLKASKILVIGAGGLGCPAMLYLTSTGIGNIGIIDEDDIHLSNLNRQIIYDITNITSQKTIIAANKLKKINPTCTIITYQEKINKYNASSIIRNYDLILDCTDNFQARYLIDTTCYNLHKTHIYGAVHKFEGHLSVFNYKNGLRYSDIYTYNKSKEILNTSCNAIGILSSITGIIGILQATEAIKIILGIGNIMANKLLTYNLLNYTIKIIPIYKQHISSKYIKDKKLIQSTNPTFHLSLLKKYVDKIIIIDLQELYEFKKQHLKYALNIPLKYLNNQTTILFIKKYLMKKIILLYCLSQSRSIIAYNFLKQNEISSLIIKK